MPKQVPYITEVKQIMDADGTEHILLDGVELPFRVEAVEYQSGKPRYRQDIGYENVFPDPTYADRWGRPAVLRITIPIGLGEGEDPLRIVREGPGFDISGQVHK
jgi:hypothetical protein